MILEPDVTLTDFGLTLECGWFAWWISFKTTRPDALSAAFAAFFFFTGLAALLGGITHGFLPDAESPLHRVVWTATLLSIGAAAFASGSVAAHLVVGAATRRIFHIFAGCVFAVYTAVILIVSQAFFVAILFYLPAAAFLLFAFLLSYYRHPSRAFLCGLAGVGLTFVAAAVQQNETGLHPLYFNHNALYHLIQAVGLLLIFAAARLMPRPAEGAKTC